MDCCQPKKAYVSNVDLGILSGNVPGKTSLCLKCKQKAIWDCLIISQLILGQ